MACERTKIHYVFIGKLFWLPAIMLLTVYPLFLFVFIMCFLLPLYPLSEQLSFSLDQKHGIKYSPIVHKWNYFQEWMVTSWLHVVMYLFQNPLFISVIQSILKRCRVQVFVFLSWTSSIHFDYKQKKPKVGQMNQIPRSNYVHRIHYFSGSYD